MKLFRKKVRMGEPVKEDLSYVPSVIPRFKKESGTLEKWAKEDSESTADWVYYRSDGRSSFYPDRRRR